jgi:hypothetical protein
MDLFKICKVMFIMEDGRMDSNTKDFYFPRCYFNSRLSKVNGMSIFTPHSKANLHSSHVMITMNNKRE